ncbi:hypothetical protein C7M84_002707 [Penaeus vannamei]|uniref:Uncharacterized protein n=1 Tax=Penaeus vannamei TaxID=6689 RepID=A0A3R7MCZ6_PENVA|nr:hypothetical protein C7M84_002707 [Penaeus vannamei]
MWRITLRAIDPFFNGCCLGNPLSTLFGTARGERLSAGGLLREGWPKARPGSVWPALRSPASSRDSGAAESARSPCFDNERRRSAFCLPGHRSRFGLVTSRTYLYLSPSRFSSFSSFFPSLFHLSFPPFLTFLSLPFHLSFPSLFTFLSSLSHLSFLLSPFFPSFSLSFSSFHLSFPSFTFLSLSPFFPSLFTFLSLTFHLSFPSSTPPYPLFSLFPPSLPFLPSSHSFLASFLLLPFFLLLFSFCSTLSFLTLQLSFLPPFLCLSLFFSSPFALPFLFSLFSSSISLPFPFTMTTREKPVPLSSRLCVAAERGALTEKRFWYCSFAERYTLADDFVGLTHASAWLWVEAAQSVGVAPPWHESVRDGAGRDRRRRERRESEGPGCGRDFYVVISIYSRRCARL